MFYYWVSAEDERGVTFAHRFTIETVGDARRRHELSKNFEWVKDDMRKGWVSPLYHVQNGFDVEVCSGGWQ